jgi:hypothetical protein
MCRVPEGRKGEAGATLVELLVGLSLLALMAALLAGGLHTGLLVWESGGRRQAFQQRLERTDGFLRQILAEAELARVPGAGAPPDATAGFAGEAGRLGFLAPLPYQLGLDGRYAFELSQQADAGGGKLIVAWHRPSGQGGRGQTVLLEDVRALRVAYFGRRPGEARAAWHEAWSGQLGLPILVRIDLDLDSKQRPERATFYYALRLSDAAG